MIQLNSPELELKVIKTITRSANIKTAAKLFAALNESCFTTKSARQSFTRIQTLMRSRGELVNWNELIADPALSESVRTKLSNFKKKPIPDDQIDRSIKLLFRYRKYRSYLEVSKTIINTFKISEQIDDEAFDAQISKQMIGAQQGTDVDSWFINIAGKIKNKAAIRLAKQILDPKQVYLLPTGFKAFDDMNGGIPESTFMILASNTSGCKSVMVGQLGENFVKQGANVCIYPLEMDSAENLQRTLARTSMQSMGGITNPKRLSSKERRNIITRFAKFRRAVVKIGGNLDLFVPQEDLTIEQTLYSTLEMFNYDVLIIDYIGLLKGVDGDDQWRALKRVTRFCKVYCRIKKKRIIVAAQLNHEGFLAASKQMAQDANLMWQWQFDQKSREAGVMFITQPKARNQIDTPFYLAIDLPHMTISDISDEQKGAINEAREERTEKGKNKFKKGSKFKDEKSNKRTDDYFTES